MNHHLINCHDQQSRIEAPIAYGKDLRKKYFLFNDEYVNLNQGAYGSHPRPVQDALRSFQDEAEAEPDRFIRYTYPKRLNQIRAALGQMLNAATDELVIIPNVTTGINTVLRNINFTPGSKIVYFSTVYGAVEKTLQYLAESTPAQLLEVMYTLPISDEDLVERFRTVLNKHSGSVKLAVFDTISSMPGVRMPFETLTRICREYGVLSLIDAAHGIGHIPLDLGSFQPDFLVTNCHKWLYVPRTAAVFYVPFHNQHMMRSSLPTSHGFVPLETHRNRTIFNPMPPLTEGRNAFAAQFEYTGTIDTAPALCIPVALEFRKDICGGEERIRKYRFDLAERGEQAMAEILGTSALAIPAEARVNFANVWLPLSVTPAGLSGTPGSIPPEDVHAVTAFFNRCMVEEYNCYMAVMFYNGTWLTRFSAEIYLDLDDFVYGARALTELCERAKRFEYKDKTTAIT